MKYHLHQCWINSEVFGEVIPIMVVHEIFEFRNCSSAVISDYFQRFSYGEMRLCVSQCEPKMGNPQSRMVGQTDHGGVRLIMGLK